jgi:hypothetical protein
VDAGGDEGGGVGGGGEDVGDGVGAGEDVGAGDDGGGVRMWGKGGARRTWALSLARAMAPAAA